MAINKIINNQSKTHGGLRNVIEYVLRDEKVKEGYVYMTGPAPEALNWDSVYNAFLEEKETWDKDSGRMCAHNIISFHKDEQITPEQAMEFGKEFAEKVFPEHQTLIAVHQDKEHLHIHLITNSVSYIDGHKLHTSKHDLEDMKNITNQMCREKGLSIAAKGKHFDGSDIAEGTITAWTKDKYQALINKISTVLTDCMAAVLSSRGSAVNKDDFIHKMSEQGWDTSWTDSRKHIAFKNEAGKKVRDSNLSKTFNIDISKSSLQEAFRINQAGRITSGERDVLIKNLQESESLKHDLEQRISALDRYMKACPAGDSYIGAARDKRDSLMHDVEKLDVSIERRKSCLENAHIIEEIPESITESTHERRGMGIK